MSSAASFPTLQTTPFDAAAETYDESFTYSLIGRAQRNAVWRELDRTFHAGQRVLELNCGTGADAVHLARRGIEVLACDVSPQMIEVARSHVRRQSLPARVEFRVLATEQISTLHDEGPFDGAYSNFAGLNCLRDLRQTAKDLAGVLPVSAPVLLCVFGRFVPWEIGWYVARGDPSKALRRLQRSPVDGNLGTGSQVQVYYHSLRDLKQAFTPEFRLKTWRGVGVSVPPSYLEPLAQRFPGVLGACERIDGALGGWRVFRGLADHILLGFERMES
jgi:SAM-dependent methyltransferase